MKEKMNAESFVALLKSSIRDSAVEDTFTNLKSPPGRKPAKELVELSNWFISRPREDQERVIQCATAAVNETLFGILCVLDGVRKISIGDFELFYKSEQGRVLLNDFQSEMLHDLYNTEN